MPTRIVYGNQTVWQSRDLRRINWRKGKPERVTGRGANREVTPVDCTTAIAPTDSRSPFRSGVALRDSEEDLVYRVVDNLLPTDGWASVDFWQARYRLDHTAIIDLARLGFLDAAMEVGSQVRRYRCRDEPRMKASAEFKRMNSSAIHKRHNQKRAKLRRPKPWADK